jgi:hypothetical protein
VMHVRACFVAGVTIEYLRGLHAAYEEFITDISRVIPVIKVRRCAMPDCMILANTVAAHALSQTLRDGVGVL